MNHCPCGSGQAYQACCEPLHQGQAASSAEALMRSRYSAFVQQRSDYLLSSWHVSTRPGSLPLDDDTHWLGLTVERHQQQGDSAEVCFVARFHAQGRYQQLWECSRFVREQGHWFYVDGDARWQSWQPGRNDACPCGSGNKFKRCCAG
ncbi:zinc chelation protein SecC [Bacterioplanes sanyensis]|uniref:UPF0225 protein CHH28_19515 n=1 Tax=Bacterioplanes sanyensis TaxID=1249553 RepID=A0A222FR71_9GAMM|nr:YchJ family protein [Bacterioplanes sanyensis]ASP40723.1 zinc chelation protein SecC [Bacterioplanes sanyensis]